MAPLALPFPAIGMDVLMCRHAIWNKPKFLAFLMGVAYWEPVRLPSPLKMANTLKHHWRQGTEGLQPIVYDLLGGGSMAEWLSSWAPVWRPRVLRVRILGADLAPLIKPCWGSVPITQLERPTTSVYNYVLGAQERSRGKEGEEEKIGNSCWLRANLQKKKTIFFYINHFT